MKGINLSLCKVRTITTFLSLSKDQSEWQGALERASDFCLRLAEQFKQHDYTVQSIRIVTNAFGEYIDTTNIETARADLAVIRNCLQNIKSDGLRIRFAIGEATTAHEISLLPVLIKEYGDLCNACVNIKINEYQVLDNQQISHCVDAIQEISKITERGEGNFNFTVNFNCQPLIPYFPASYHQSSDQNCYVIGLETPDLLVNSLQNINKKETFCDDLISHQNNFKLYFNAMHEALQYHVDKIDVILKTFSKNPKNKGFIFSGIDSSAAPSKSCSSMVDVYKEMGVPYFGSAGTVEASALLTRVFKSIKTMPLVGFSGLMLAVTEDTGLAQGTIDNDYDIRSLLTYSAVCGIGLDTVPIPGDTPHSKICAIMRDTGSMAFRLNKPLTVRVFPIPNKATGDLTEFESDDLCNCAILAVP